jgi:ankyrin repeat protein
VIRQRAHETDYINPIIEEAVTVPHVLLFEFLCSIGVNIHPAISTIFPCPLYLAIERKKLAVIRLLIQQGVNCNNRDRWGQTLLFKAVAQGSLDVVRILVEDGGASVDVSNNYGWTLIQEAERCLEIERQDGDRPEHNADIREKIVEYLKERLSVTYNKARLEKRRRICIII